GSVVTKRPTTSLIVVGLFILISATYNLNLKYEFDLIKSFPEDMPSRVGYELLEQKFAPGDLAPTSVLVESDTTISEESRQTLLEELAKQEHVSKVRVDQQTENEQ